MTDTIYVDANGELLGIFGDGATPPDGAVEVPSIPLRNLKTSASALIQALYAKHMQSLTGDYSPEERGTWPTKREAAQAYSAGNATTSQITTLTRFAAVKSLSVTDYAALVLAKADAFEQISAACEGVRDQGLAAVEAATNGGNVQTVVDGLVWPQVPS